MHIAWKILIGIIILAGVGALVGFLYFQFATPPPLPDPEPEPTPEPKPDEDKLRKEYEDYVNNCIRNLETCNQQKKGMVCFDDVKFCLQNAPPSAGSPKEKEARCYISLVDCIKEEGPLNILKCVNNFERCKR